MKTIQIFSVVTALLTMTSALAAPQPGVVNVEGLEKRKIHARFDHLPYTARRNAAPGVVNVEGLEEKKIRGIGEHLPYTARRNTQKN